jgi:GNAT superfamily N-acetyltransferase
MEGTVGGDRANVEVRRASADDLPTLLDHRFGMIESVFSAARTDAGLAREIREANQAWLDIHFGRDYDAWIGWIDDQAAGSAAVLWFPHPPTPSNPIGLEAYVLSVFTRPEFRRRGVARALMNEIVEEARRRGIHRVWLRFSNEGRPLYVDLGFAESNYLELMLRK